MLPSFLMGQLCSLLLVLLFSGYCVAGPVREDFEGTKADEAVCEVKNVTFAKGDVVPDVAPCETCVCEPPEIKCSPLKCQANNGCKIIQQSGKCCPEYKCDCEHKGTTYNNGEKLHNPSSPCQVCYCRGGEIMCNSITCYRRDDCEPQHVEGQCCPKYGHCPSKNSSSVIAFPADPSGLSTKREMQPWLLTKSVDLQMTETPSKYPQTIKIVEILPTQAPTRSGEVSLVPRIITNGGPDRVTRPDVSTASYSGSSSTEASDVAEPLKMSPGPSDNEDEALQPDSETYTTLLPQMMDVTAAYEELAALSSGATEGTGYDMESGGTFFQNTTKEDSSEEQDGSGDSSEENHHTSTTVVPLEGENPKADVDETFDAGNHTMSANLEIETTHSDLNDASTNNVTSVEDVKPTTDLPESSSDVSAKSGSPTTRHGLTIPPILNLNHQFHHLTLGGTGEEVEDTPVVRIGVYNPTMPGEVPNMVTVIQNEDTAPSANSETTQVLLTPQDLKTLAEMIIKEKIKAPNAKLELGTTPLPTEFYDETTGASPESIIATDNATSTEGEIEETTPSSEVSSKKSLTKEEEKAQAVIDRLTSNVHAPLQGIELVDANDTATTEAVEVLPSNNTEILSNKDAEWVEVSNSTKQDDKVNKVDKIAEVENVTTEADSNSTDSSSEETSELDTSTIDADSTTSILTEVSTESGKSRGSLRQMEDLVSQLPDDRSTDRRTRISTTNDHSKLISMSMFDEKDQMLVENFFKKALDFQ